MSGSRKYLQYMAKMWLQFPAQGLNVVEKAAKRAHKRTKKLAMA